MPFLKRIVDMFKPNPDQNPGRQSAVVLRNERSPQDTRYLEASLSEVGDLIIHGTDWGAEVVRFWGSSEYEWIWTIRAQDLPALGAALHAEQGLLQALKTQFSDENAANLGSFLDQHTIKYESWSRVGD